MKHKIFLFTTIMMALMVTHSASAYDFSYSYQGKTLYYNLGSNGSYAFVVNPVGVGPSAGYVTGALTIPDSVENNGVKYVVAFVGDGAFRNCGGLTSVTISSSVTSINQDAFKKCTALTSVSIPNSVVTIGQQAFFQCSSLVSLTIPSSVTSIGEGAFDYCNGLTSIVVENGNTHYDSRDNCNAIIQTYNNRLVKGCRNTIIPNSVTSIGYAAFKACSGLSSLTIPNSVIGIESSAFENCSNLMSVTIGNSVISIGSSAFENCSNLISVTIGNSVTSIGESAFRGCGGLMSVIIPDSVTAIGKNAFRNCIGLTSVTIGSSVYSIGDYAFNNCSHLTTVFCMAVEPPNIQSYCFGGSTRIYVPCESVNLYISWPGWSTCSSNIYGTQFLEYVYSFAPNNEAMGSVSTDVVDCDSNVTVTATANDGFLFYSWSDGDTINPRTFHLTSDTIVTAIFVVDSSEGIYGVEAIDAKIFQRSRQIVVEGANGNTVMLFDINGRMIASKRDYGATISFDVPATGIYMIKIGSYPVHKIVVIR